MIKKKTVLILGAGASIPYGFPSGDALFEIICKNIKNENSKGTQYLLEAGFTLENILEFGEALFYSGKTSIDEFLEHRKDFLEIGRYSIAMSLIPYEDVSMLYSVPTSIHWYKELYKQMNTLPDKITNNNISFITFNYDRTLEHFLFTSLSKSYNLNIDDGCKLVNKLKIFHVHGNLGNHPYQDVEICKHLFNYRSNPGKFMYNNFKHGCLDKDKYYRDYNVTVSASIIKNCAKNINVIHNIENEDVFEDAKKCLDDAEVVLFFGFGFHILNIERLGLNKINRNGKYIAGTGKGLTEIQKDIIVQKTNKFIMKNRLYDMDITQFLREKYILK
jgi:hypothetical protein